ncbi:SDR family NAD(P)-dependent oxidoreductase [Naasia aerilata]|uniref:SDR family NAD(P)-dependent oxidoreductase n=1 Tax=Naasia aerilata TaxID=1162966 RepID=UPI002572D657|nr:SDR family NAD(P)-dependent oxidoreductase [Naasia aerilata]
MLVMGASYGIGADAARVFAEHGASVMLFARGEDALRTTAERIQRTGPDAAFTVGDVSVAADVARAVDATAARFGRLDGAFNCAAMTQAGLLDQVPESEFDRIMAVNVKGTWLCMREELRIMREAGAGSIVNVSSVSGTRGGSGLGAYNATKHAVIGLTRTAAHDNGPRGIRVNALAPGPTETPMLTVTREAIPGGVEARIASTPLRKAGSGVDVGQAAAWLLSDSAGHISGIVLPVDGGLSA